MKLTGNSSLSSRVGDLRMCLKKKMSDVLQGTCKGNRIWVQQNGTTLASTIKFTNNTVCYTKRSKGLLRKSMNFLIRQKYL